MPNRPENYVDKKKYAKTRYEQRKRYYQKTQQYPSRPWTKEEEILIMEHDFFDTKLSEMIKRSVGAIQANRCSLKKKKEFLSL